MRRMWNVVVLAAVLLAGCATEPASTPEPLETSTATATSTRRILPSPTRYATQTLVPSLSLTITITSTPTITQPPFPTSENARGLYPESISPSKEWSAWRIDCSSLDASVSDCFIFVNSDGAKLWPLSVQVIIPELAINNYVSIGNWSNDKRFVYLVTSQTDIEWYFWTPVNGIIKFSLVNGLYSYIITPKYDPTLSLQTPMYQYAFSSDSHHLVYGDQSNRSIDLTILDL